MKKISIILSILICPGFSLGQIYFNELIDLAGASSEVYRELIYDNQTNSFWTQGATGNSIKPRVFHFDESCNALDTFEIDNSSSGDQYYIPFGNGSFIDHSGNHILCGSVGYFGAESNASIFKFNEFGDTIWTKEIGDSIYFDLFHGGIQDSDTSYLFAGCSGTVISSSTADLWLVKTDTNGNILWQNNYGGSNSEYNFSIDTLANGGFLICGRTQSYGAGSNDIFVIKTDPAGNMIWQKWFGMENSEGGLAKSLPNGNILVYGQYRFEDPNAPGNKAPHGVVMELDQNGDQIWEKVYSETDSATAAYYLYSEWFNSMAIVSDGYVFCGASVDSADGIPLGWIVKTDFNGNLLWSRRYRKRDSDNYLQDVVALPGGDLVLTGFVFPENVSQTQDGWLLRTNCLGFDGPPIAAGTWHNAAFNEVIIENESTNYGDGLIIWGDLDTTYFTEFDDSLFSHTFAFSGFYPIKLIVNACGESDTTIIFTNATQTSFNEYSNQGIKVFPNPSSSDVQIRYDPAQISGESSLSIFDLHGHLVYREGLNQFQAETLIDVSGFEPGTYILKLISDSGLNVVEKLVVYR